MTYDEFKRSLKQARISVKDFATVLDMNPTSITNYKAKGRVPRHLAVVVTLFSALSEHKIPVDQVLSRYLHMQARPV